MHGIFRLKNLESKLVLGAIFLIKEIKLLGLIFNSGSRKTDRVGIKFLQNKAKNDEEINFYLINL